MLHDDGFDRGEVAVEPGEVDLGGVLLATGAEAAHVGEEDRHPAGGGVAALDLGDVVAAEEAEEVGRDEAIAGRMGRGDLVEGAAIATREHGRHRADEDEAEG